MWDLEVNLENTFNTWQVLLFNIKNIKNIF